MAARIARPYFVDVFEVEGGSKHDYAMHGCVYGDMVGATSLPAKSARAERPLLEAGEKWAEPKGMGGFNHYGLFRNVKGAPADRDFHVDFTCKDAPETGTRIHMLKDDSMVVHLGETPALRLAGHYKDKLVYKWWMPHLLARRKGNDGLKSVFVAVYDMFAGGPKIRSVRRLRQTDGMVALKIDLGDRTDTLLYSFGEPGAMSAGGVQANGKLALVAASTGKADAYLVAGTRLKKGSVQLSMKQAGYAGTITGAARRLDGAASNAFVTTADLPEGAALRGKWMVVTHGKVTARFSRPLPKKPQGAAGVYGKVTNAYQIDRVEKTGGKTWIHLTHDHGLRLEGNKATEVFSMWRTYEGGERFMIHMSASTAARPIIEPGVGPWDRLKMRQFTPFMDSVRVTMSAPGGGEIRYSTDGSEPTIRSARCTGPFALTASATVKAIVPNPGGIQAPRVVSELFQKALSPVSPAAVRPGLLRTPVSDGKAGQSAAVENFILGASVRGRNLEEHFEGFVKVPHDGIYTFYMRCGPGAVLSVGGLQLIDNTGLGYYRLWSARIALKAGLHPVRLVFRRYGARGSPMLMVKYSGPGVDGMQPIPDAALFHAPKEPPGRE